jgi:archaellum component FlaC
MSDLNYKTKYNSLKAQFKDSLDVAFRLGYEQGAQAAQMQNMQQQTAQAQQLAASPGGNAPGSKQSEPPNGEEQSQPGQEPQEDMSQGSELDNHIGQLEQMIQKGESSTADLMKAIDELKDAKHKKDKKPFVLSHQANHNLSNNQKQAVSMQHKIVEDVMKSWKEEESRASNDVHAILAREGLFKSEE